MKRLMHEIHYELSEMRLATIEIDRRISILINHPVWQAIVPLHYSMPGVREAYHVLGVRV
jgi:hypothetical protein